MFFSKSQPHRRLMSSLVLPTAKGICQYLRQMDLFVSNKPPGDEVRPLNLMIQLAQLPLNKQTVITDIIWEQKNVKQKRS